MSRNKSYEKRYNEYEYDDESGSSEYKKEDIRQKRKAKWRERDSFFENVDTGEQRK